MVIKKLMEKILITGANGSAGLYLTKHLSECRNKYKVIATGYNKSNSES